MNIFQTQFYTKIKTLREFNFLNLFHLHHPLVHIQVKNKALYFEKPHSTKFYRLGFTRLLATHCCFC